MTQTSNPERKVPTRRMSFEESIRDLPRHFAADGDLIGPRLAAFLRVPDGEDYFVRSVRHFRDQITDPALKRQVAGFIGQEAVHGREHRVFNDRLAELGYPTKRYETFTRVGLRLRERVLPPGRTWPPPPRSSTSPPRWPSWSCATRRSAPCSVPTPSGTSSSGTRSRSPSTRPSPSTSTGPSVAASACGCGP